MSTLIDDVWAPEALPVRCSGPLRRLASEIQLINTHKLKDHLPLGLDFDYVQLAGSGRQGKKRVGTLIHSWKE